MRYYLLLVLVVLGVGLAGCAPQPVQDAQGEPARQITAEALEAEVQAAFGADLESVTVTSSGARRPTYRGEFTLRDSRLRFTFQMTPKEQGMMGSGMYGPNLLHDRTLVHNDALGGNVRFVALAHRYEADFPDQSSMSYWMPYEDGHWPVVSEATGRDLQHLVAGLPGPHVLVFNYNDYWRSLFQGRAKPLGVYTWDAEQEDWRLLSRGPIPLN